jgi:hypothetical protein
MNQSAEPLKSAIGDGRIVEATVTLDGSGWIGWNRAGEPVRLDEADADDLAIIDMAMSWREESDQ